MSKKAEARIARKIADELKRKERAPRSSVAPTSQVVRSEYAKDRVREIRAGADPNSIFQMRMTCSIDTADRDENWSWGPRDWSADDWAIMLAPKLKAFGQLTWAQINEFYTGTGAKRRRMHHDMEKTSLSAEAQDRLSYLEQNSELIFRFRLGGKVRLWGIRVVSEFQVLWYDPEHQIYPVD